MGSRASHVQNSFTHTRISVSNSFPSRCSPSFTGATCNVPVADPCASNPCRSANAICLSVDHRSYYCLCEPYAVDVECDFNRQSCTAPNSQCENGGVCDVATGLCDCLKGFKGHQCAVASSEIDHCASSPCHHGGVCRSNGNDLTFGCICREGFNGTRCQTEIEECSLGPPRCMNGATCTNTIGGFFCNCTDDYCGRLCNKHKHPCQSSPCQNGGACLVVNDDAECLCPSGEKKS